ncbi:hypothetical protein VTN77DRAFT_8008 [Rasamsonia byssochlamydoides]|uniref:uncharacterized protein n=1 Tax=Rasamsonia byssochlamydoides TaxID=89139 RepID=UPI0037438325
MAPTLFPGRVRRHDVLVAIALLSIFWLLTPLWQYSPDSLSEKAHSIARKKKLDYRPQQEFWRFLHTLFKKHDPEIALPEKAGSAAPIEYNATHEIPWPEPLQIPPTAVDKIRDAHQGFVNDIKADNPQRSLPYKPGARGIVTAASGASLPVLLVSLRMIRRTHTILPMEVFMMSEEEYEPEICEDVLPSLNATCIIISDIVGTKGMKDIQRVQLKSLAILFSSFEDVLWLDSDCFPLRDPVHIFQSEAYQSTGLITWPDFWAVTTSPLYYEISSQHPLLPKERASTEAGELFVSKKKHRLTLMLVSYYNYYGPSHYYPLLSQGTPGEGDKETFLAAASALGEPFYAITEGVRRIGHPTENGDIAGSAMVQYDPTQDEQIKLQHKNETATALPRALFIHVHYPEFDPATIFDPFDVQPTRSPDGKWSRAWTKPEETLYSVGLDTEIHFWEEIKWVACNLEYKFQSWKNKWGVCERVTHYWNSVFEGVQSSTTNRKLF